MKCIDYILLTSLYNLLEFDLSLNFYQNYYNSILLANLSMNCNDLNI